VQRMADGTWWALGAAALLTAGAEVNRRLPSQHRPPEAFWPAAGVLLGGALALQTQASKIEDERRTASVR